MTPKQVTTIDVKELRELELRCECGTSIRLPLPLKNQLPLEQDCLGRPRKMWAYNSPVRTRIANLLSGISGWSELEQNILALRFVLTEKTLQD